MILRKIILFTLMALLPGCSSVTKLEGMPIDKSDYFLEKTELVLKYPDISIYEYQVVKEKGVGIFCFDSASCLGSSLASDT